MTSFPRTLLLTFVCVSGFASAANGQDLAKAPSAQQVDEMLQKEPISLETWPTWKVRLNEWFADRSRNTDKAYEAAREFAKQQANDRGELTGDLAKNYLAWYFLGSRWQFGPKGDKNFKPDLDRAEKAFRRSLVLKPDFAHAHRNLARVLLYKAPGGNANNPSVLEAQRELQQARTLDPKLQLYGLDGELALRQNRPEEAERIFREEMRQDPKEPGFAIMTAMAVLERKNFNGVRAPVIQQLLDPFPNEPSLVAFYGLALALDNDFRGAKNQLDRVRALGADPEKLLSPDIVRQIEDQAKPSILEWIVWSLAGFVAFYAIVMASMVLFGLILAGRTRGQRALELIRNEDEHLVENGYIARLRGESMLARLYGLTLFLGLILFYLAIPFVIVGILALMIGLLMLIFMAGRIPVKLVIIIIIVGLGSAWGVFKSLFSKPASGAFGVPKTSEQEPRLHDLVRDVSERVDTDPVDEIYIAPGSAIGVHQEGRGPFGVFGVKKRVLTLGLSTMRFLSVGELQAILAHEYAHFSHKDTFYGRFIYQVHLSISQALQSMANTGGWLNYVNPFFWFLYLYYKCYSLLSAGHSRSREFLADRMACCLFGSDVFTTALAKVCTEGVLFEMTIYDNIARLLEQQQAFVNMYDAFKQFRDEQMPTKDRDELYQKLLDEKGSLFADHPTFAERLEAVADLPKARQTDRSPALELFANPEEIEKELTQFLTGYMAYLHELRLQSEAAASQA